MRYYDRYGEQPALPGLVAIDQRVEASDLAITVTAAIHDGETFLVGWKVENLAPKQLAIVLYEAMTVDGEAVQAEAFFPYCEWMPCAFDGYRIQDMQAGFARGFQADVRALGWRGQLDCVLSCTVLRPAWPLVLVDADLYATDSTADAKQWIWEVMDGYGIPIAGADELDPEAWVERGYTVVNSKGALYADGAFHSLDTLPAFAALRGAGAEAFQPPEMTATPLEIRFQLDADAARALTRTFWINRSYALDDCAVRVEQVRFAPTATVVELLIMPSRLEDNTLEGVDALMQRYFRMRLLDGDGQALALRGSDGVTSYAGSIFGQWAPEAWAGKLVLRYGPLLGALPDAVRLSPDMGAEGEMAARAEAPADRIVIPLDARGR